MHVFKADKFAHEAPKNDKATYLVLASPAT